jgi:hypothetical protein
VRKEVSEVRFFPLDALPPMGANITRCMGHVRHWISRRWQPDRQQQVLLGVEDRRGSSQRRESVGDLSVSGARRPPSNPKDRAGSQGRTRSAPGTRRGGGYGKGASNAETFGGAAEEQGWSVEDMFKANEQLTGRKFTYDGNPHQFGNGAGAASSSSSSNGKDKARAGSNGKGRKGKKGQGQAADGLNSSKGAEQEQQQQQQQPSLAPAVALLLSTAAGLAAQQQQQQQQQAQAPVVHSCASLEQDLQGPAGASVKAKAKGGAMGGGAVGGLDSLATPFQFDTSDILAALQL